MIILFVPACVFLPSPASADILMLRQHITAYNLERIKKSLSDHSYRGEEGILRINPEVGASFGFMVVMTQDYLTAKELFQEAEELFEKAIEAMKIRDEEAYPGEHIKKVAEFSLHHNRVRALAWEHLMAYRSTLTADKDERLNDDICSRLLEKLLREDIERTSYNLRDALGSFYNRCQMLDQNGPLNLENIDFVNYVFNEFTRTASEEARKRFDLDRYEAKDVADSRCVWNLALRGPSSRFSPYLETIFEKHRKSEYPVDELLFLALIRQESGYYPRSVSYMGAVGLTQIMPGTAKQLGMKDIFAPPYFEEAGSLLGRERMLKRKSKDLILEITEENSMELARQARNLMQEALDCGKRREELYAHYRQELLELGTDDRLNPHKALKYGLKYFSQMMKIQEGDISLALASYNAGPRRVKEYRGIPPFEETIKFRNKVLNYYRIYKTRVREEIDDEHTGYGKKQF